MNTVWHHYDWRRCIHFKPPVEKCYSREKITNTCLLLGKQRARTYKCLFLIQFSGISCSVYAGCDRTRARVKLTIIIAHVPNIYISLLFSTTGIFCDLIRLMWLGLRSHSWEKLLTNFVRDFPSFGVWKKFKFKIIFMWKPQLVTVEMLYNRINQVHMFIAFSCIFVG